MATLRAHKVVAALPATLDANALYLVRVGGGFDLYATDDTGAMALGVNTGGGAALESHLHIIYTGTTWTAPADGFVRLALAGAGGRGAQYTGGGGGAGELRGCHWRAVAAGDSIALTIGAASGSAALPGGATTAACPWGTIVADGGYGGVSGANAAGGAGGGAGGSGGDWSCPGGPGGAGSANHIGGGGALNPFGRPPADLAGGNAGYNVYGRGAGVWGPGSASAGGGGYAMPGWLGFFSGAGETQMPGAGGSYGARAGLGGGSAGGSAAGAGVALLDFAVLLT
ncbi:hypothetical protein [Ottowia sp.]|uniref:hypothetical protein n=1 Tax=Ottowia sp. TaxID=1898956 RepID=UPI003A8825F4